jgi:vitamin B12 transporter
MSPAALAQEPLVLPDIVVTAPTRTPLEAARTGTSVAIVDETELQTNPAPALDRALERLPGVSVATRGGPGASAVLSVRGFEQEDLLIRADGIELVDPSELQVRADPAQVLTGDIRRIEVLKGAQSALYGGEAAGGVIDIDTSVARGEGRRVRLFAEGGSFDTARGGASFGMGAERWDVGVSAQGLRSGGISAAPDGTEDDGARNLTLSGVGSADLADWVTVGGALRYIDRETEIDGTRRRDIVGDEARSDLLAGRAFLRLYGLRDRLTAEFSAQQLFTNRDFDQAREDTRNEGERTKLEWLSTFAAAPGLDLLVGADWTREETQSDVIDGSGRMVGPTLDAEIAGAFAQAIVTPLETLTLTAALRHDDHDAFGGFTTGRVTAAWEAMPGTVLRGAYGTGFRAPSVQELFDPAFGNPDLDPEETLSWEVGVDQRLLAGRAQLSATYFRSRTEDEISFVSTSFFPVLAGAYQQIAGQTEREGVEVSGRLLASETVELSASYTYLQAERPDGLRVDNAPRHDAAASATWRATDRLTVGALAVYTSGEVDSNATVELDSALVVDVTAAYAVDDGVEIYGRVSNLFDEAYRRQADFAQPGVGAFVGLRATF